MKKKKIVALGLAVSMLVSIVGCGSSNTTTENTDDATTETATQENSGSTKEDVSLVVWSDEENFPLLEKMIESFKQEHSGEVNLEVSLESVSDSVCKENLLGDVQNGADVFGFADDQLMALVAAGAIEPVANADEVSKANLAESVSAATVNNILYAYPMTADNGYFLYYDKNYLTAEDVQSIDKILEVAAANEKVMTMDLSSGWYLYAFFGCTGLELGLNDDGVTNYCNWNESAGNISGADITQAMLDITSSSGFRNVTDDEFMAGVADGSVIAGISGVWNAVDIKEIWGDDYGAVKLPTYTCAGQQIQMSSFTGYKMMGVNYYSEHKDWAMKLADWFTNEENQTLRFVERNQGPSNINAAASDAVSQVPAIQAVISQSEFASLQRVGNKYWDPCTKFGNAVGEGNPDGLTPQELVDELVAGITASTIE